MPRAKKYKHQKPKSTAQDPEPIERDDDMDMFDAGDLDKEELAKEVKKDKKEKKDKKDKRDKKEKKNKKQRSPTISSGDTTTEEQPTIPTPATSNKKKRKLDSDAAAETDQQPEKKPAAQGSSGNSSSSKPPKKRKKSKTAADTTMTTTEILPDNENDAVDPQMQAVVDAEDEKECNHRFIVFVGNIPFGTTQAALEAHFAAVHPSSVRRATMSVRDKNGQKTGVKQFRGIAFVEFPRFDYMKTALKTLHHSTITAPANLDPKTQEPIPDGKTVERKINVELTVGGGGNTDFRKNKIRTKNDKLKEERARRIVAETSAKEAKAIQAAWDKLTKKNREGQGDAPGGDADDDKDVHPSRRGRLPIR